MRRGLAIGLTGGIGCGKSEVARILKRLGAEVADADEYAHEALRPSSRCYRRVVKLFGKKVIGADGMIDRRAVARKVLNNQKMRTALESIVHPIVIRRLTAWVKRTTRRGQHAVAVVPLLHEVGMTGLWDAVICVVAPRSAVLARLAKRGLTRAEALAWIRAQMPVVEKARRSDFVIRNDGTLHQLERITREVWSCVLQRGVNRS